MLPRYGHNLQGTHVVTPCCSGVVVWGGGGQENILAGYHCLAAVLFTTAPSKFHANWTRTRNDKPELAWSLNLKD